MAGVSASSKPDLLLFDSDRRGNYEIFAMLADGSGVRQLTDDATYDSWWPRLSPDQQRVLFYRTPRGSHDADYSLTSLWSASVDGSRLKELRARAANGWELQGHAEWSPDGQQIVMFGGPKINPQLFVTDADGQQPRPITDRGGQNLDPSWSPDGSTIVFIGCPSAICVERNYEVYAVPASGGTAVRLTQNDVRDQDPYYSPDGSQVAWIGETQPNAFGQLGIWSIFVLSASGGAPRNVTDDRTINSRPQWSRDGRLIYFHRFRPGQANRWSIFSIHPDGTGLTEVDPQAPGNSEYPST